MFYIFLKIMGGLLVSCFLCFLFISFVFPTSLKKKIPFSIFSQYKAINSSVSTKFYYSAKRKAIFYKEQRYMPYILFLLPLPYSVYVEMKNADYDSFEPLSNQYARDSTSVFYKIQIITKESINQKFEVLDQGYVRLGTRTFFKGKLESSNPDYTILDHGYTLDGAKIFRDRIFVMALEPEQNLKVIARHTMKST